jgi:hypothetical protein
MANAYSGSYRHILKAQSRVDAQGKSHPYGPRGIKREHKRFLAAKAEERNARTPHTRTRAHRLGRCACLAQPPLLRGN